MQYSPMTPTDVEAIVNRLSNIRRNGHAVTRGEVDVDAMGIAAPIFDHRGAVEAALSFVLLQSRLPEGDLPRMIEGIKDGAADISRSLSLYAG